MTSRPSSLKRRRRRFTRPRFSACRRIAPEVKIIKQDAKKREVTFSNGVQNAGLQANPLGDKLTQLVVASTLDPAQPSATSLVVKSIQNVCTELKVECTLQTD